MDRREWAAIVELREAAARTLAAIETVGAIKAISCDDDPANWNEYIAQSLVEAHYRLDRALRKAPVNG